MPSPLKKSIAPSLDNVATGYVQTLYFDMEFKYIGGSSVQISIAPDAPKNWESETCTMIPYARYEYTRLSKKNPETSRSGKAQIDQAREKVRLFASETKNKRSTLRIVKRTIVTELHPYGKVVDDITYYLEESYDSMNADVIASKKKTSEFPSNLKEIVKGASKKGGVPSNRRHKK
jgi:hypothetical protein